MTYDWKEEFKLYNCQSFKSVSLITILYNIMIFVQCLPGLKKIKREVFGIG